ncbi:MAG: terminase large subunit [Prevotella sp.]|nr:terminase large subunit [Prevotella sp.]
MIEEERKQFRALKAKTAAELQRDKNQLFERYEKVLSTEKRLAPYIAEVITHPDDHNIYELLKVKRFFEMLSRWKWNSARAKNFIIFYELLKFNSTGGRRTHKLSPVQVFQFCNIFGFEREDGRRLIREVYLFVPRKFGKTTSMAGLAVYDLLFGDHNAEAYIAANSYDQAKKCFDEVRGVMRSIDPTQRHVRINREVIKFQNNERDSLVQCLTANAKTKDGLSASLVIMDEYAQARNTRAKNGADLKNVLTTSMGIRENPLTVIITTASEVTDGPFFAELEGVMKILRGEMQNDMLFADLFMPDVDDKEDDPHTWAKVQPHIGITVQKDFYENNWASAQKDAESMLAFRTKLLNVFAVNEAASWLSLEKANDLLAEFNIDSVPRGTECAIAFSLSVKDDFSSVSYTVYNRMDGKFYSYTDYYFPEGALKTHPNEMLYRSWHEQGYLKFCKGDIIDVEQIANDIIRRSGLKIIRISYDSYKAQDLVNILSLQSGGKNTLVPYPQTNGAYNIAVESFEMMIGKEIPRIVIDKNPINSYCLVNCAIDIDRHDNKKPVKIAPNRKIDGTLTLLMTIGTMATIKR